jgi:hypothetical protein
MTQFKIGDRVKFIRDSTRVDCQMRNGEIGTITKISWQDGLAEIRGDNNKFGKISVFGLILVKSTMRELLE